MVQEICVATNQIGSLTLLPVLLYMAWLVF